MSDVQEKIAQCNALFNPDPNLKQSVIGDIVEQVTEWVQGLDLASYGKEGLHLLLHFIIDTVIPGLVKSAPESVDVVLLAIIVPLLKKIDDTYYHAE